LISFHIVYFCFHEAYDIRLIPFESLADLLPVVERLRASGIPEEDLYRVRFRLEVICSLRDA
jgi:hypothetical protein